MNEYYNFTKLKNSYDNTKLSYYDTKPFDTIKYNTYYYKLKDNLYHMENIKGLSISDIFKRDFNLANIEYDKNGYVLSVSKSKIFTLSYYKSNIRLSYIRYNTMVGVEDEYSYTL